MTRAQTFLAVVATIIGLAVSWNCSGEQAKSTRESSSPSAFHLIKEGNRYVSEQSHDKVVQIRSERSKGTLTPSIWYVVYFDESADLKATEVKFGNGRMLDVQRPLRLLSTTARPPEALPKDKLKIDSDQALKIAGKQSALEGVTLKSSEMRLEKNRSGEPVWRIGLWGSNPAFPDHETPLGEITVDAANGKVIENNLKAPR